MSTMFKDERSRIALNAFTLLLFLGLVYAWSVFKKPLALRFGWTDAELTWTFTICMSTFCLGGFVGARLGRRVPSQRLIYACAIAIALGFLGTAFVRELWQLYLTYGVVIGAAIGIAYNTVLGTVNRWYPQKSGLVSGLLLMAFGSGSLIFGPFATWAIERLGWQNAMLFLGVIFLLVFFLTGGQIVPPQSSEATAAAAPSPVDDSREIPPARMLKRPDFWLYLTWSVLIVGIGMALVGQVTTIAARFQVADLLAAYLVGIVSVCNGLGRVLFGALYDSRGRAPTMLLIALCPLLGGLILVAALNSGSVPLMVLSFLAISLGNGGAVPTNANFVRSSFGNRYYATNFSIVNFNLLGSVVIGQYIGSTLYMQTGSYLGMAQAIVAIAVAALLIGLLIRPPRPASPHPKA